jgi:hypothetical protein
MVFISVDELLPAARAYGFHHQCVYGLIMLIVAAIELRANLVADFLLKIDSNVNINVRAAV